MAAYSTLRVGVSSKVDRRSQVHAARQVRGHKTGGMCKGYLGSMKSSARVHL